MSQGESRQEARHWLQLSQLHLRGGFRNARAHLSPCCTGIDWRDISRIVTRASPSSRIIRDIRPRIIAISEDQYCNKLGGCSDIVVEAYLSLGVLMDCNTRLLPAGHNNNVDGHNNDFAGHNNDVHTAPPFIELQTRVGRAPQDPSLCDMVSRAPNDPSLEVAAVNDVPALSSLDRVDISQLSSRATPLPHPILPEAAVPVGDEAMATKAGVGGASLTKGGVRRASLAELAVDLGDEVRYVRPSQDLGDEVRFVRPSQAKHREPRVVRGSVLRASFDGVVDTLNNVDRRAIIREYGKRLLRMLQVVQFDNPLPFLIARTSRSVKRVHFLDYSYY